MRVSDPAAPLGVVPASYGVRVSIPALDPNPTVFLLADTLTQADVEPLRKALLGIHAGLPRTVQLKIALLSGQGLQEAAPKTRAQLQAAVNEMVAELLAEPVSLDGLRLYATVAKSLSPTASWRHVLFVGRFPTPEPEVESYAGLYLAAALAKARIRASFWDIDGRETPWLAPASERTAGWKYGGDPAAYAKRWKESETLVEADWAAPAVDSGFEIYRLLIHGGETALDGEFAGANGELPDPAFYRQLPKAYAELKKLAADPSPQPELAEEAVRRIVAVNPREAAAFELGAGIQSRLGRHSAAAPLWKSFADLRPTDARAFDELGNALFHTSQWNPAEAALRRAVELNLATARNTEQLARIRLRQNDDKDGLFWLAESLRLNSSNQPLWFERAAAAERVGDRSQAVASLESGLALGGLHVERRAGLIRLYLELQTPAPALRHLDAVVAELPPDAKVRQTFADLAELLARTETALSLWRATVEADPSREAAHFRASRILLDLGKPDDAVHSAEAGITAAPSSARLRIAKVDALDALGRHYNARQFLNEAASVNKNLDVLRLAAERADVYSRDGAAAYRRWAEALPADVASGDRAKVLRRGLEVAIREESRADRDWFASRLTGDPIAARLLAPAPPPGGVLAIPGGRKALASIAFSPEDPGPSGFLIAYARTVAERLSGPMNEAAKAYSQGIVEHFALLASILPTGVQSPGGATFALETNSNLGRKRTEQLLSALGWKIRFSNKRALLEAAEKGERAKRHRTTAALAVDEIAMQEAIQAGRTFTLFIPIEEAAVFPPESAWKAALYPKTAYAGGLAEAFARDPRGARVFVGLNSMERRAAEALLAAVPLAKLVDDYSDRLYHYGPALAVANGGVVLPGGSEADGFWKRLLGVGPSPPSPFLAALVNKDDGRPLSYFCALSQLDSARQRFFTKTQQRTERFYRLFTRDKVLRRTESLAAESDLLDVFQNLPLTAEGQVRFPGSPEVWMVAKGQGYSTGLQKKLNKAVAPDVEDEILLRLAKTEYKPMRATRTELDNFLGVARVDAFRRTPLDETSALKLAQHYAAYQAVYPHFTRLTALDAAGFDAFFAVAGKLRGVDRLQLNRRLSLLLPLFEILGRLESSGDLTPERAAHVFQQLCESSARAEDLGQAASAALDAVRAIVPTGDAAEDWLRDRMLGLDATGAIDGLPLSYDYAEARRRDYERVLEAQRITRLGVVLEIDGATRALAGGEAAPAQLTRIERGIGKLERTELPKQFQADARIKNNLQAFDTKEVHPAFLRLKAATPKKKVNPKSVQSAAAQPIEAAGAHVGLALTGVIYGAYLRAEDLLVSEDPLLARKHEFADLTTQTERELFRVSDLRVSSEKAGSYFLGGFAQFGDAVGQSAAMSANLRTEIANVASAELGSLRVCEWRPVRNEELRLVGLQVRAGREWILRAGVAPVALERLAAATVGLLSVSRRTALLDAVSRRRWDDAWASISLSEQFFLGARAPDAVLPEPIVQALRRAKEEADPTRLARLGAISPRLCECQNAMLAERLPYEEYARRLRIEPLGERLAEFKLYLAYAADSEGVSAAALAAIAEPLAAWRLSKAPMADSRDWVAVLRSYAGLGGIHVRAALERKLP